MIQKELAQAALDKLNATYELAKTTKYNWKQACQEGTYFLHNSISGLERDPLRENLTLYDFINELYKEALSSALSLHLQDDLTNTYPEKQKEYEELRLTIESLPETLPRNRKEFDELKLDCIDWGPLHTPLWSYIEEADSSFDLGDDGTDEMEQDLETLFELITIFKKERSQEYGQLNYEDNLIYYLADNHIRYKFDKDGRLNPLTSNPSHLKSIITHIINNQSYFNDAVNTYLLDLIEWNNIGTMECRF